MRSGFPNHIPHGQIENEEKSNAWGKIVNIGIFVGLIGLMLFVFFSGVLTAPGPMLSDYTSTPKITKVTKPAQTKVVSDITSQPPATPTPAKSPSKTPFVSSTPTSQANVSAQISCEDIENVNLRKSPGYIDKNDARDVVLEISCGKYVDLLGEYKFVDNLTWWKVSWNDYEGWMADHTSEGRVILIFNPQSSLLPSDPTEFIKWYFGVIWKERNYEMLWSTYLTSSFQNYFYSGGIKNYSNRWSSIKQIEVHSVYVLQNYGSEVLVKVEATLYKTNSDLPNNWDSEFDLIFNHDKKIWMFDHHN